MEIIREIARDYAAQDHHGSFFPAVYSHSPDTGKARVEAKHGYHWYREPLPDSLLRAHCERQQDAGAAVGLERERAEGVFVKACVFDIDDHGGRGDGLAREAAGNLAASLARGGYRPMVVSSGGGDGFHVWLFFEREKRKDVVRSFMKKVLASAGLTEGTRGIHERQVECYPTAKLRALIALPFARLSRPFELREGSLLEADAPPSSLPVSADQRPGPKPRAKAPVDIHAAFDAFVRGKDGGDYDQWVRVGMAVKAALGDAGFDLWAAWSAKAANYCGEAGVREKWDNDLRNVRTAPEAFWAAAKRNGYAGGLPDGMTLDKKRGEQAELLDIVRCLTVVRSDEGGAYVEIAPRTWAGITSKALSHYLVKRAMDELGLLPGPELIKSVLGYAEASASDRGTFHVRCAREAGRVFYAIGDDAATVLELTPGGLLAVEEPPVRFKRTDDLPAVVADGGSIADLAALVNVDEQNLHLLVAVLVKMVASPDTSHPLLLFAGPQGVGKSSNMEAVVRIIDPRKGVRAAPPKKEDDLIVAAANSYVVSFDNVSNLYGLSDALCRLATGGGNKKRTLYSDADLHVIDVKRPVVMTGIDPPANAQDLVSRMVRIDLVPPKKMMADAELEDLRERHLPRARRFILDLACRVLGGENPVVPDGRMRLNDFASLGEATTRLLGRPDGWFFDTYAALLDELAEEEAEGDLVVTGIRAILGNGDGARLEGPSEIILRHLQRAVREGEIAGTLARLPDSPRGLSSRIRKGRTAFDRVGIDVQQGARRSWIFAKRAGDFVDLDKGVPF